jgi:hypothetical protein
MTVRIIREFTSEFPRSRKSPSSDSPAPIRLTRANLLCMCIQSYTGPTKGRVKNKRRNSFYDTVVYSGHWSEPLPSRVRHSQIVPLHAGLQLFLTIDQREESLRSIDPLLLRQPLLGATPRVQRGLSPFPRTILTRQPKIPINSEIRFFFTALSSPTIQGLSLPIFLFVPLSYTLLVDESSLD